MLFEKVPKDKFYEFINPRDIVYSCGEKISYWKTREGMVVGRSTGFLITDDVGEEFYEIRTDIVWEKIK